MKRMGVALASVRDCALSMAICFHCLYTQFFYYITHYTFLFLRLFFLVFRFPPSLLIHCTTVLQNYSLPIPKYTFINVSLRLSMKACFGEIVEFERKLPLYEENCFLMSDCVALIVKTYSNGFRLTTIFLCG